MNYEVHQVDESRVDDFYKVHEEKHEWGWCFCVSWWVDSWEGFKERTRDENKKIRDDLFARGEFDGYLCYADGKPVGWCQVGQRDKKKKLLEFFKLEPDADVWSISCYFILPDYRQKGIARLMLKEIIADLKSKGVRKLQAYPYKEEFSSQTEQFSGPRSMYLDAGFKIIKDDPKHPIFELDLTD